MTTFAVVDDSTAIRIALPLMLPGLTCAGAFESVEELLRARPVVDVVVLDLRLASGEEARAPLQGVQAVRRVTAEYRVCLYTDERRRFVLAACLRAGALGVVHKSDSAATLLAALEVVAAGGVRITRTLEGLAELLDKRSTLPQLTSRQQQVLAGRARGESFQSIASRLFITVDTAKDHMQAVNRHLAHYLRDSTPAELAHLLGILPGDLVAEERSRT